MWSENHPWKTTNTRSFWQNCFCVIIVSLCLRFLICNMRIIIISTSISCCEGYLKLDHDCEAVTILLIPPKSLEAWVGAWRWFDSSWYVNSEPEAEDQGLVLAFTSWLFISKYLFKCLHPRYSSDCIVATYANKKMTSICSFKLFFFFYFFNQISTVCFICICLKNSRDFFKGRCVYLYPEKSPLFGLVHYCTSHR